MVAQPTWMRRVSPAATMSARRSICLGSRSSRPTTFAVPLGHIASRTRLPTRPCNASLFVPSPPDTITSPAPFVFPGFVQVIVEPAHHLQHPVHHIEVGLGVQMAEHLVGVIQHIDVSNLACGAG